VASLHALTTSAAARLRAAGIAPEEADMDAQLLAARVLGWDRTRLITCWRDSSPPSFAAAFEALVARRERREPISQILSVREFWGLEFEVTRDVLTPRPETEGIVEAALEHAPDASLVEDIGTGSGCIAIALAKELPHARFAATDISPRAIEVARRNAARHGVSNRIAFAVTEYSVAGDVDLIVSNPPYIPDGDRDSLPTEVRDYEPPQALFAGADGLDVIRGLLAELAGSSPGTQLIFECGTGQDAAIRGMIAADARIELVEFRRDLAGIPRIAVAKRKPFFNE
jgi:release factor glutamine methyltransferase